MRKTNPNKDTNLKEKQKDELLILRSIDARLMTMVNGQDHIHRKLESIDAHMNNLGRDIAHLQGRVER